MRSNLGVGLPVDLVVVRGTRWTWEVERGWRPGEPYFHDLRERWSAALRKAHKDIPSRPTGRRALADPAPPPRCTDH